MCLPLKSSAVWWLQASQSFSWPSSALSVRGQKTYRAWKTARAPSLSFLPMLSTQLVHVYTENNHWPHTRPTRQSTSKVGKEGCNENVSYSSLMSPPSGKYLPVLTDFFGVRTVLFPTPEKPLMRSVLPRWGPFCTLVCAVRNHMQVTH